MFTNIRNEINKREDEVLLDVDRKYNELFLNEKLIKENEKFLNNIKKNKEHLKINNNDWNDNNKLSFLINNCLNIEKNINYIDDLKKNIDEKYKNFCKKRLKINSEELNNNLYEINSFNGLIIDKKYKNDFQILMLGLDFSGKTKILYQMKMGENEKTCPTIGFNVEEKYIENDIQINN